MSLNRLFYGVILFCIISFLPANALLAETFKLEGKVIDSKGGALIGANVVLLDRDEKAVLGKVTDRNGKFVLPDVNKGKYKIKVTYIGYDNYEKDIFLREDIDLKTIKLVQTGVTTEEVVVSAPMTLGTQKVDTTEYNSGAFKVNKDASTEDLVKKMPGVQVEQDGTVKAQGEQVKKVFVDGKQFFGDDPSIAMKNIPAEIVDKIQVYDKMSDQAEFTGFDDGNKYKAMNIVTKGNKRNGTFGKANVGGGDEGKYIASANVNYFNGDTRLTFMGLSNNVNQQNFSHEDILGAMGGNNRIPRQLMQLGRNFIRSGGGMPGGGMGGGPGGGGFGGFGDFFVGQSDGKNKTHSIGMNYSDNWTENMKISGSYFFNASQTQGNQILDRQYYLDTITNQIYNQTNKSENDNYNHRLNLDYNWQIDSSNSLQIKPRISYQDNSAISSALSDNKILNNQLLNYSNNAQNTNSKGYNFNNDFIYRLRFNTPGRTISLAINNSANNKQTNTSQTAITDYYNLTGSLIDSVDLNLNSKYPRNTITNSGNLTYTEPISKDQQLSLSYDIRDTKSDADKKSMAYDTLTKAYSTLDTTYSNVFNNNYVTQKAGSAYRYRDSSINMTFGLNYQVTSLKNDQTLPRDYEKSYKFYNLLPSFQFNYKFTPINSLWFNYRVNTNVPSVEQLQDYIDNSNTLQLTSGNPNLRQDLAHNLMVRYNNMDIVKGRMFFTMLSLNYRDNYIANSIIMPSNDTLLENGYKLQKGVQFTKPINLNGNINLLTFASYNFPLGILSSNLNTNLSFFYNRIPGMYNNVNSLTNSYVSTVHLVLGSNISENVDFTISSRTTYTVSKNDLYKLSNQSYFTQYSTVFLKYQFWKTFFIQADLSSNIYSKQEGSQNPNITLLNFAIGTKLFANDNGEIKLGGYDLLNQNSAVQRSISELYIENSSTEVLKRYFLLTFTYSIRKFY